MARKRKRRRRRPPSARGAPGRPPVAGTPPVPGQTAEADTGASGRVPAGTGSGGRPGASRAAGSPPAPWGSFPLSEIVVLIAIVLLIGGFIVPPPRGVVMIGAGLVLGSLAGLELSAREHFAGYRSHTLLLAGAAGFATLAGTFALTNLSPAICAGAGALVFGACAWLFGGAFRRRSGGALFRIRS